MLVGLFLWRIELDAFLCRKQSVGLTQISVECVSETLYAGVKPLYRAAYTSPFSAEL